MTPGRYYDPDGNPIDMHTWADMFEHADRQVARTEINESTSVSTVYLGLDHQYGDGPPLIYETMIFGGEHDEWCWRYPNRDAALAGHDQAVALAREPVHR
jgi:hypothetical protein